jgi:nitrate/nitrite-specific signal transduction histidine kinase
MEQVLGMELKGGIEAPAKARAVVTAVPHLSGVEDSVALLVSELVTNSVQHAAAEVIELNVFASSETVRVEVRDQGSGHDAFAVSEPQQGGFGLYLVDKIADRWGVETRGATLIWFEIHVGSGARARSNS